MCLITAICLLISYGCVFVITFCCSELSDLCFPPVMKLYLVANSAQRCSTENILFGGPFAMELSVFADMTVA